METYVLIFHASLLKITKAKLYVITILAPVVQRADWIKLSAL